MKSIEKDKLIVQLNTEELSQMIRGIISEELKNESNRPLPDPTLHTYGLEKELIPRQDLARKLGISLPTLDVWTRIGDLPPKIKRGGRVYYRLSQVEECLNRKRDE